MRKFVGAKPRVLQGEEREREKVCENYFSVIMALDMTHNNVHFVMLLTLIFKI
jgi:hypothetical protein